MFNSTVNGYDKYLKRGLKMCNCSRDKGVSVNFADLAAPLVPFPQKLLWQKYFLKHVYRKV